MKKRLPRATTVDEVQRKAHDAATAGQTVFTPTFRPSWDAVDVSDRFGELIAAVEAQGWHLDHWTVSGQANLTLGCPVFRRA